MMMSLQKLRKQIDGLDAEMVKLLNERIKVALEIGKTKKEHGGEIYVPSCGKAVFDRIAALMQRVAGTLKAPKQKAIIDAVVSILRPLCASRPGDS